MLPAKLTPIEEYFLLDDCPAYPMTVLMRLRLAGRLDRELFAEVVQDVVRQHPLLRARVDSTGSSVRWVDCPDWLPTIEWDVKCDESAWPPAPYINVRNEPGTRFRVVTRDEYEEVIIQVHHCSADATGLCRLTQDLLLGYAKRCAEVDGGAAATTNFSPFTRIDSRHNLKRFHHRGLPSMPRWMFALMLHRWRARISDAARILFRKCCQLVPDAMPRSRDKPVSTYPDLRFIRFDRDTTTKLISAAKSQGVTVNSVLLRDLFLAIRDWRMQLGANSNEDMLRFCVPVNLRTERDSDITVTNSISLTFMDRNDEQMQGEDELLKSIQRELHEKRRDLRVSFVTMLHVARILPGGMKRFLANGSCWSTCVFSSLGVLFRDDFLPKEDEHIVAGNVRLEQWDLIPPMRDNLGLTICPYTYAGRMSIAFNYDPSRIKGEQLAQMLKTYLSRLEASTGITQDQLADARWS